MSGGGVVERFETFVDPGVPIPKEIERLTGIRSIDVAGAPDARTAVAALADFVAGSPVLAHNATFDRTFVEAVPGGAAVSDTWIDTLALSRIALPMLSTHRLADMAAAFGCAAVTHRSSDDVDALCGMWRILLLALSDLPQALLARLAGMHPEVDWPFRPVFSYLSGAGSAEVDARPFSLREHRTELLRGLTGEPRSDAAELERRVAPSVDEVEREFAGRGYGEFKLAVGEAVADALAPIKQRHDEIIGDKKELERLYKEGAQKAEYIARKTYFKAMKKVGFVL